MSKSERNARATARAEGDQVLADMRDRSTGYCEVPLVTLAWLCQFTRIGILQICEHELGYNPTFCRKARRNITAEMSESLRENEDFGDVANGCAKFCANLSDDLREWMRKEKGDS